MKPIKISPDKLFKIVENLKLGETAWIKYESMWVDFDETLFVDSQASSSKKMNRKEGYLLRIKMVEEGVIAYYSRKKHNWEYNYSSTNPNPIFDIDESLTVVAKSDAQYHRFKNNPSPEDVEDEIHEKHNELFRIQEEFYGNEKAGEKDFIDIGSRARACKNEIALLVKKREEILSKLGQRKMKRKRISKS